MSTVNPPVTETEDRSRFVKGVTYFLEEWRVLTIVFERTFTSNMAATVPWIAPLIPASFAFKSTKEKLGLTGNGIPFVIALAIEGLGMSVVSTAFELWDWNDKNKDEQISTPIYVSIATVVFYIVLVLFVNVGLDLGWPQWIIKAMLSLLSIPAVVTLALRSQHGRRVAEKEAAKLEADKKAFDLQEKTRLQEEAGQAEQRRLEQIQLDTQRTQMEFDMEQRRLDAETRRQIKLEKAKSEAEKVSGNFPETQETFQKDSETSGQWRAIKKNLSPAQLYAIMRTPINELAHQYGKTEKAVQKWAGYAAEEIRARGEKIETTNT